MNNYSHIPVLLKEAIDSLKVISGKKYIDTTLGGGGHSVEIVKRGGIVLGIDQDEDAIGFVKKNLESRIKNHELYLARGNFRDIKRLATDNGFTKVDGILFDLGVSSYQLDVSGRGFSIKNDEKLDMRMDKSQGLTAFEVVNSYSKEELVEIFYKYGEEHNAKVIAAAIVDARKKKEIESTKELAELVMKIGHKPEAIHPATRVFQAIRIEVNGELDVIKTTLSGSLDLLDKEGRLVVISFHSLEDRIVKQTFGQFKRQGLGKLITDKPVIPTFEELSRNKRARSAKMRVFEKN